MTGWNQISQPIPEGTEFVAFIDAERQLITFGQHKGAQRWRPSLIVRLAVLCGLVKPQATHWYALPKIPAPKDAS